MDCETSIASITTARLRGIRTSCVGPAIATVSSKRDSTNSIVGRCRHRVGRVGATLSSSSMFANRSSRFLRASWTMMYSPIKPRTTSRKRKYHACPKPDNVIGPNNGTAISGRTEGSTR